MSVLHKMTVEESSSGPGASIYVHMNAYLGFTQENQCEYSTYTLVKHNVAYNICFLFLRIYSCASSFKEQWYIQH